MIEVSLTLYKNIAENVFVFGHETDSSYNFTPLNTPFYYSVWCYM